MNLPTTKETYELYFHPVSSPSRVCMMFMDTLQIPYKKVFVDLSKFEQKTEEYMKKHPVGQVPLLGIRRESQKPFYIFESFAILKYLSVRFPNSLFPLANQ